MRRAASQFEVLPPNDTDHHKRIGERIERKTIDIGRGKFLDFITDSTLIECELRIWGGARCVNLSGSELRGCTIEAKREMRNLRFTSVKMEGCVFAGKYLGCRFGKELDTDLADIRNCDFSGAALFHLCDFYEGVDVGSLRWPAWPHVVVTDLPDARAAWIALELPADLQLIQRVIGDKGYPWSAITIHLPTETSHSDAVRELLASQAYIKIADPTPKLPPREPGGSAAT